jgi:hypothetical protein
VRIIRRPAPRVPVSEGEKRSRLDALRRQVAQAGEGAALDRPPRVPEVKPAFETFYVASDGTLWVEPSRAEGDAQRFEVFDPEGRYLGTVRPPHELEGSPLPLFRSDAIHAVIRDSLDVPYVVRVRIRGRGAKAPT